MSERVPKEEHDEQIEAEYVRETKNSKGLVELGSFPSALVPVLVFLS